MRTECLYNGEIIDIAEIYEVKDGKQINIPEKLEYYRGLSNSRQLYCSCGCGAVVILVAGENNLRKQHFRLLSEYAKSKCEYQEETPISLNAKKVLRCWLGKSFPVMGHEVKYKVPISQLTESKRRYELTMYSEDYDIGIIYHKNLGSILAEKMELLSEYAKTKIIYVTQIENEETDGQYPERMMRIQEKQGYCFYLASDKESLYEDVEAKVSVYVKTHRGWWETLDVCKGMLDDFGLNTEGLLVYKDELVSDLVENRFRAYQENVLERIKKCEEEERLRQEKETQARAERERLEEERRKEREKEREERRWREEEERNRLLGNYHKFASVYELLKTLKSIKGEFASDQGDGKTKNYLDKLEIDKLRINVDKHRIEVSDLKKGTVYIYILEGDFREVRKLGTGNLYKVLDYRKIDDVERAFRTIFDCAYKEDYSGLICSVPDIKCQFLGEGNACTCGNVCTYQER